MRSPEELTDRLLRVRDLVEQMQSALVTGHLANGIAHAAEVVAGTTGLLDALLEPGHDPDVDPELISTLRVYRNAAFVFRQLVDAGGAPDAATVAPCASTIEQGHDHWLAYVGEHPDQARTSG